MPGPDPLEERLLEEPTLRPGCARWPCGLTLGFWALVAAVVAIVLRACG